LLPKEIERLLNEKGVVLENTAMPGIRKNAQLCIRQPAGQFERVDRRHQNIVVAISDQDGMLDCGKRNAIALAPGMDRYNLGLNCFVGNGRISVLRPLLEALTEIVGCGLAICRLRKE
jgi:hypothetical protein